MKEKKPSTKQRANYRKRTCPFLSNDVLEIDYKLLDSYSRYITDRGKIMPKRNTGVSTKFQRKLAQALKRARYMGLIAYEME